MIGGWQRLARLAVQDCHLATVISRVSEDVLDELVRIYAVAPTVRGPRRSASVRVRTKGSSSCSKADQAAFLCASVAEALA